MKSKISKMVLMIVSGFLFLADAKIQAVEINFYPSSISQGDPVLVSVKGDVNSVQGKIFGKKVLFKKVMGKWIAIFGVDILRKTGDYFFLLKWFDSKHHPHEEEWRIIVHRRIFPLQKFTVSKKYDKYTPAILNRIKRENSQIRALWKLNTPVKWEGRFLHPLGRKFYGVKGHAFGDRRIINGIPRKPHSGADYPVPRGTPVYAPNEGVVVLTGHHYFAGNSIYIDHGGGLISMYFHLSKIVVKKDQHVKKGQEIGRVGSTGRVTGPHLHFGVYWQGERIDPDKLLALPIPEE